MKYLALFLFLSACAKSSTTQLAASPPPPSPVSVTEVTVCNLTFLCADNFVFQFDGRTGEAWLVGNGTYEVRYGSGWGVKPCEYEVNEGKVYEVSN